MWKFTQCMGGRMAATWILAVAGMAVSARGALVTDPALTSGADAIDPAGSVSVSYTASTATQADLEGISSFGAIHGWSGFTDESNIVTFTDTTLPAIRFTPSGTFVTPTGKGGSSTNYATSDTSFDNLRVGTNGATVTYTIDFGTYAASTFAAGTASVRAVGFCITNYDNAGDTVTVTFKNAAGSALSTQTANGADVGTSGAAFFGLDTGTGTTSANAISSVTIAYTQGTLNDAMGLDDFGFSAAIAVPEPASFSLLGMAAAIILTKRRRGCV
jgi:hypothetical protein